MSNDFCELCGMPKDEQTNDKCLFCGSVVQPHIKRKPFKCPDCGAQGDDISEAECSNLSCVSCGTLYKWCIKCDWEEHPHCETEI